MSAAICSNFLTALGLTTNELLSLFRKAPHYAYESTNRLHVFSNTHLNLNKSADFTIGMDIYAWYGRTTR